MLTTFFSKIGMSSTSGEHSHIGFPALAAKGAGDEASTSSIPCQGGSPAAVVGEEATPTGVLNRAESVPVKSKSFAQALLEGKPKTTLRFQLRPPAFTDDGEPAVFFPAEDIAASCETLKHAIIAKCSYGRPSIPEVKAHLTRVFHLSGEFILSRMNARHMLIRLDNEEDFIRLLLVRSVAIKGFLFRFFRWQHNFDFKSDPPVVPAWISFPEIPVNYYNEDLLTSIAGSIGKVLRVHETTLAMSNTSEALVCVELNLEKPRKDRIWIGTGSDGFWQDISYNRAPILCASCHKIGHSESLCRKKVSVSVNNRKEGDQDAHPKIRQIYKPKIQITDNLPKHENQFEVLNQVEEDSDILLEQNVNFTPDHNIVVEKRDESSGPSTSGSVFADSNSVNQNFTTGVFLPSIQEISESEFTDADPLVLAEGLAHISSPTEVQSVIKRKNVGAISSISLAENSKMLSSVTTLLTKSIPKLTPPSMFPGDLFSDTRLTRAKAKAKDLSVVLSHTSIND